MCYALLLFNGFRARYHPEVAPRIDRETNRFWAFVDAHPLLHYVVLTAQSTVTGLVERFDRRGTEPFELMRARSRLYRSQILQVNIRSKALDKIYKIYMLLHSGMLLHCSDLKNAKFRQTFCCKFAQNLANFHE